MIMYNGFININDMKEDYMKLKKSIICFMLAFCFILVACGDKQPTTSSSEENTSSVDTTSEETNSSDVSEEEITEYVSISQEELYDKLLGAWVGQMAGVVLGADNEFWFQGRIMPETEVPDFTKLNINNAFGQDDLYVEITYIEQMVKTGFKSSLDLLGEAFKNSTYGLDHANKKGRENLRDGIAAGDSGSYLFNPHCDDIDWQINADFVGEIYVGLVKEAAERAFEIGHITNYGDGVYGGVFVAAMHSKAYVAESVDEIIAAGFDVIPDGTKFKEIINDVKDAYDRGITWEACWQELESKWASDDRCPGGCNAAFNIDAKLNAAYVLMGLLWGDGDFEKSMKIAMRCGQDSDCNPSSVGAILGNFYGYSGIPDKYKAGLDMKNTKFIFTNYSLEETVYACLSIIEEIFEEYGAVKEDNNWVIPVKATVTPVAFEQWPDEPVVTMSLFATGADVKLDIYAVSNKGIKSISVDFGDGTVIDANVACYTYDKAGEYTVTVTAVDNEGNIKSLVGKVKTTKDGNKNYGEVGKVRNLAPFSAITISDSMPTGSGSKDINVIRDGDKSYGNTNQYDTYVGYLNAHEDYIGYLFPDEFKISSVVFTEGMHFGNGGWFADGTLRLEIFDGNAWVALNATSTPAYPNGNTMGSFGAALEAYTWNLDNVACYGIRLIGKAGGDAGFISCAELEVFGVEATN